MLLLKCKVLFAAFIVYILVTVLGNLFITKVKNHVGNLLIRTCQWRIRNLSYMQSQTNIKLSLYAVNNLLHGLKYHKKIALKNNSNKKKHAPNLESMTHSKDR